MLPTYTALGFNPPLSAMAARITLVARSRSETSHSSPTAERAKPAMTMSSACVVILLDHYLSAIADVGGVVDLGAVSDVVLRAGGFALPLLNRLFNFQNERI